MPSSHAIWMTARLPFFIFSHKQVDITLKFNILQSQNNPSTTQKGDHYACKEISQENSPRPQDNRCKKAHDQIRYYW
jgi:hypothetical protein